MARIVGGMVLMAALGVLAQTPAPALPTAWATYATGRVEGGPGDIPEGSLVAPLEGLGRAWGAWVAAQPVALRTSLPPEMKPDPNGLPRAALRDRRGPWSLLALEVPVPCGSHTFLALVEDTSQGAKLRILDLRNPPREGDPLGAREGILTLLLPGGRMATAATPPWCTSCWSRLDVRVLAPGPTPDVPEVVAAFEDGVYRCAEDTSIRFLPQQHGLRIDYTGEAEPEVVYRKRRKLLPIP